MSRTILVDNRFDSGFSDKLYCKVSVDSAEPEIWDETEEFKPENEVDDAFNFLNGRTTEAKGLKEVDKLIIELDVLAERTEEGDWDPISRYHGEIKYSKDTPSPLQQGCLGEMEPNRWANWIVRLLVLGSIDAAYTMEVSSRKEQEYFVVRREVRGIFIAVFELPLEEGEIDDSMDIMADLRGLYSRSEVYKRRLRELSRQLQRKEEALRQSEKSKELLRKSLDSVKRAIESSFIPKLNSQAAKIRELEGPGDLDVSSIRKDRPFDNQEPGKKVSYELDKGKMDEYLKDLEDASPRKKRKKVAVKEERADEIETESDDDELPVMKVKGRKRTTRGRKKAVKEIGSEDEVKKRSTRKTTRGKKTVRQKKTKVETESESEPSENDKATKGKTTKDGTDEAASEVKDQTDTQPDVPPDTQKDEVMEVDEEPEKTSETQEQPKTVPSESDTSVSEDEAPLVSQTVETPESQATTESDTDLD